MFGVFTVWGGEGGTFYAIVALPPVLVVLFDPRYPATIKGHNTPRWEI